VISVRPLTDADLPAVDARLPLHRLDQQGERTYLVAWDAAEPVGHAHIAWRGHGGIPEIQDAFVLAERRDEGVGSALTSAAEREAAARGHREIGLTVSVANIPARRLYERLGYADSGEEPQRVSGTITLRGEPLEVDDTLVWLVKRLAG
jgi:ribosomal protein S18 acetylase RimI-like enzyme